MAMCCCRKGKRNYFENKFSILITGAASGIGKRIAIDIAVANSSTCTLILLDIDSKKLEEVKSSIVTSNSKCIVAVYVCDTSSSIDVSKVLNEAKIYTNRFPIACIISNAGIVIGKDFDDLTSEDVEKTLRVNVFSSFNLLREILPSMKKQGFGTICFTSSVMGLLGSSRLSDYCASKAALNSLAESLRLELSRDGFFEIYVCLAMPYAVRNVGMFSAIGAFISPRDWVRPFRDTLFPQITDKDVSRSIIDSIKQESHLTFTIPFHLYYLNALMRLFLPLYFCDLVIGLFGGYHGLSRLHVPQER